TESELVRFLGEKLNHSFESMVRAVEANEPYSEGLLSTTKASVWHVLSSFTHTGFNQIVRRSTADSIQSNYSQQDICRLGGFVNSVSILAGMEIVHMVGSDVESTLSEFLDKATEFSVEQMA